MKRFPILILVLMLIPAGIFAQCNPPVYIGFMVHLEDNWNDDVDSMAFVNHRNQLHSAAGMFKHRGAKFTAECAIPFGAGCLNWGQNILQDMIDSTMGVGSHANDSKDFAFTKGIVDQLVGAANNRGISGGWTFNDGTTPNNWADSAATAGFEYQNAPVYLCYLSIPQNERPDSVSDFDIINGLFHEPVPKDFAERIHPHRITSSFTFHTDTTGPVVFLTGSLGEIHKLADGGFCQPCILDSADIDTFVAGVNRAISLSLSTGKHTNVYVHSPLAQLTPDKLPFYSYLFDQLQPLVIAGDIHYATMGEIYDAFVICETNTGTDGPTPTDLGIEVFPNPAEDRIELRGAMDLSGKMKVEMLDLRGRLLKSDEIRAKKHWTISWDVAGFPKGIYLLRFSSDQNVATEKLILR